jgi:hypothetical protein
VAGWRLGDRKGLWGGSGTQLRRGVELASLHSVGVGGL